MRPWWCCRARPARREKKRQRRGRDRVERARGPAVTAGGRGSSRSVGQTAALVAISAPASGAGAALSSAAPCPASPAGLLPPPRGAADPGVARPHRRNLGAAASVLAPTETTHGTTCGRSSPGGGRHVVGRTVWRILAGAARTLRPVVDRGQPLRAVGKVGLWKQIVQVLLLQEPADFASTQPP